MGSIEKPSPMRALILITSPKLEEKATSLFEEGAIPIVYHTYAVGTAPSEMMDLLGLGSPEKRVLITLLPKVFAEILLKKLKKALRLGTTNSGIAFTVPMSGANASIYRLLEKLKSNEECIEKKGDMTMHEFHYSLIAAVINQGYSEEVMNVAREAGAAGGTVIHCRQSANGQIMNFWGMNIQEEKEILLIVADKDDKVQIMKAIGEKFGVNSETKGIVVSLPIESVIGLGEV